MSERVTGVDQYIDSFPGEVQVILEKVRRTIHDAVPGAGEKISYQIPTITLDGRPLMYFSGWQKHISLYPIPRADEALDRELAPYRSGKGTLKFPLSQAIPYNLIGRLAVLFVEQRKV